MSRHRADVLSLLTGLAFTGLGLAFLGGPATVRLAAALSWPVVLAALALALLTGAVSRRRARGEPRRRGAQDSGSSSRETEFMQ